MRSITISKLITDKSDMSLSMFLKDISKFKLIDANKEIELALRIRNGDKKAINELVEANLRFVVSIAKTYQHKGLPLVDLIQHGVIGLREAAIKYDPTKGVKFISYAVWWIRQAIILALSTECRTVRIPTNQVHYNSKINKVIEKYEQTEGRIPSIEELEKETELNSYQISLAQSSINKSLSLDTPFKDEESNTLGDTISNSDRSDENLVNESIHNEIMKVLSKFPNREQDIVKMYYGIGMESLGYEEIAVRFGVGEERIRQIRQQTIDKIKRIYGNRLRELL